MLITGEIYGQVVKWWQFWWKHYVCVSCFLELDEMKCVSELSMNIVYGKTQKVEKEKIFGIRFSETYVKSWSEIGMDSLKSFSLEESWTAL